MTGGDSLRTPDAREGASARLAGAERASKWFMIYLGPAFVGGLAIGPEDAFFYYALDHLLRWFAIPCQILLTVVIYRTMLRSAVRRP
jgi:hypothetical protein